MAERDFQALIAKYLAGEASHQEEYELRQWVDMDKANEAQFEASYASWEAVHRSSATLNPNIDQAWDRLNARLDADLAQQPAQTRPLWGGKWLRYAAAIALLAGLGWLIQWSLSPPQAYLYQAGTTITAHRLPDSSQVWLQPGSELSYTEDQARRLQLKGTAYFEVKRDEQHPFVIQVGATEVRVLGTSFTIMESDTAVSVLVSTGKVSFASESEKILLEKGLKGTYAIARGTLDKETTEVYDFFPGQDTYWVFDNTPLQKVAAVLSQHYAQDIRFAPENMGICTFTGTFVNEALADILQVIALATDAALETTAEGYLLQGKGC